MNIFTSANYIDTQAHDGRTPLSELYAAYGRLGEMHGWQVETITWQSVLDEGGRETGQVLPVVMLLGQNGENKYPGKSLWVISGVHGEEPAGAIAVAQNLSVFEDMRARGVPVALVPMVNPAGYRNDWRFFDARRGAGNTVLDPDHVLPDLENPYVARKDRPSTRIAEESVGAIINRMRDGFPPWLVLDLHEDEDPPKEGDDPNKDRRPYIYSHGALGHNDPAACEVVRILDNQGGVGMRENGITRFGERIKNGIVVPTDDGSVEQLMISGGIISNGGRVELPVARSVIVTETSVFNIQLEHRVRIQSEVIRAIPDLWEMVQ